MKQLWSPWRSQYIQSFDTQEEKPKGCFLCEAAEQPQRNEELLVVARRTLCFVIMNRYPYNSGHIMVVPYRHIGDISALLHEELQEIMITIQESAQVLQKIFKPDGMNIGANLGRAAGAGAPDHIHFHLVPRWNGDTNFMATFADIKVISSSLEEHWQQLADAFLTNQNKS